MASKFYEYMKFDEKVLYDRYSFYVRFFQTCKTVLDLGCGRGEFLELLRKEGKAVVGVDNDPGMVRICRRKKLRVIQKDILRFLLESRQKFDGIFCAHVIEHLPQEQARQLISLCKKSLHEHGVLVMVTPNPASLHTQLHEFWRDPDHVRMYSRELLEFLVWDEGLRILQSGENERYQISPSVSASFLGGGADRPRIRPCGERRTISVGNKYGGT